jgi:hypothetical protein
VAHAMHIESHNEFLYSGMAFGKSNSKQQNKGRSVKSKDTYDNP